GPLGRQHGLDARRAIRKTVNPGFEDRRVLRGLDDVEITEERRADLHPGAMDRPLDRIVRVELRTRLRLLDELRDHAALEQDGFAAIRLPDLQEGYAAERRDFQEPVGLCRKVDVDAFE